MLFVEGCWLIGEANHLPFGHSTHSWQAKLRDSSLAKEENFYLSISELLCALCG